MNKYNELLLRIAANWELLRQIPPQKINEAMALHSLHNTTEPYVIGLIPSQLITSDFLVKAVKINPSLFQFIEHERLNKAIIAEALRGDPHNIVHIPDSLIDEEITSAATFFGVDYLKKLPEHLITESICLQAIISDPMNLADLPRDKITYELALEAVERNGLALEFVPAAIRENDIYFAAIQSNPNAIKAIPFSKQNPEIAKAAVSLEPSTIRMVAEPLRTEELWIMAIESDPNCLSMVNINAQTAGMINAAVSRKPETIVFSNTDYVGENIANLVSKEAPHLVSYVPHEFQSKQFLRDYLIEDPTRIGYLNNQSLLSKIDLIQWLSNRVPDDSVQEVIHKRIPEFCEKMAKVVEQKSDIDHIRAAMDENIGTTEKIINLAYIKPFSYTKVGKLCVELNAEVLLKDLFGGKVYERFFRKKGSLSVYEI